MKNYLVTYKDAMEMVEVYKDFNFSASEFILNGYKVVSFGYFLCDYDTFMNPLKDKPEVNALDMRGVTFTFDKEGNLVDRFFMLRKFFNLNQVESTQYGVVADKKIRSVTTKEDGSLVAFMNTPDSIVFAKTIGSFDNEQSNAAMKIFKDDSDINLIVKAFLYQGFTPLFEYVSWDNRIVLKYGSPELRLLGMRNNKTGEFVPGYRVLYSQCKFAAPLEGKTLDELIEMSKTEEDVEGWVVEFEDGQFIKLKTNWYFNLHGIRTTNVFREDWVIKNYLEENLDDAIGQLDEKEDEDAFKFMNRVTEAVDNYIEVIDKEVAKLKKIYEEEYKSNWPSYATFNNNEAFFGLSVSAIQNPELYNKKKIDFIINKTKHLNKAKFFVDKWSKQSDEAISKWRK